MLIRIGLKNIFTLTYLILLASFSFVETAPPAAPKPVLIKLTLQEAEIVQQILARIELATQEVEPYLAISKPLDQLLTTTPTQGVDKASKQVILRLPLEATNNLLLFLERANIPALGAKQIEKILKKIEKSLPKGNGTSPATTKKPNLITLHLTQLEAQLTQQLLDQIDISVSEVEPFLSIYVPLEQESANVQDTSKDVVVKLPEIAPRNLLLFLERTRIVGQQAKIVHTIVEKLHQMMATLAAANNTDKPTTSTP
ncbi:MAG: hypothetical protein BGO68_03390 [Candidatus Amoebophilus sp. 36-38]|nr:MAG: hypothetical protein BGO68_03390 [Candidatus Amoebophilus sp. 36-38]